MRISDWSSDVCSSDLADILKKTKGRTDPDIALGIARESAATIAWMRDSHGVPLQLIDGFLYPGHSAMRMYGTPHRTGGELMAALDSAAEAAGIQILTDAVVESLFADPDGTGRGVRPCRTDGTPHQLR